MTELKATIGWTDPYSYTNVDTVEKYSTIKDSRYFFRGLTVLKNKEPLNRANYNKLIETLEARFPTHKIEQVEDRTTFFLPGVSAFFFYLGSGYIEFSGYFASQDLIKTTVAIIDEYVENYYGNGTTVLPSVIIRRQPVSRLLKMKWYT